MLLAIDVGNTNVTIGLFDDASKSESSRLIHQFRIESARNRTADEYAVFVRSLLDLHKVDPGKISAAIIE